MIKKTEFCADSLNAAVVRQIGGWSSFKESADDIANNSIDGGFNGFIYHTDTVKFARRHLTLIRQLATDQAADFGDEGAASMVRGFNCLTDKSNGKREPQFTLDEVSQVLYSGKCQDADATAMILNALAWYAGEAVARRYSQN